MKKEELVALLQDNHSKFILQLSELTDADFCYVPEGKWSAAQQLDHIVRSVQPVNLALGLPRFVLKWRFGTANRPSKTFDGLVEKYTQKLREGGRASGQFLPADSIAAQRILLAEKLNSLVHKLCRKTKNLREETLDRYILPHPLLGKLTLREMLYFTAYHVEHHRRLVEKGLQKNT